MQRISIHPDLRSRNPLLRSFKHNIPYHKRSRVVPTRDLSVTEKRLVKQRLAELGGNRVQARRAMVVRTQEQKTIGESTIDIEKRNVLKTLMANERLSTFLHSMNSPTLLQRWRMLSDRDMLGGHDFTITGHIEQMFQKYMEFAGRYLDSSEDIFIGAVASVLHDIGKLGGRDDYYHPLRSAVISRKILSEMSLFTTSEKRRILALVENHALIGNITIHGEGNSYPKGTDDMANIGRRKYSNGRLYAIGPISDYQYIKKSLSLFLSHPGDLDILLYMQLADTYAVKKDGSYLNNKTMPDFIRTYRRLKKKLLRMLP